MSVPPPLSVSQVPRELVESLSCLCPTADPTASLGPGLAGRVCSTYCPSLPLSTYLTSHKPHFFAESTVLRTRTCHHTQSFQTHPPPCRSGLSTSTAKGPIIIRPSSFPDQLEASLRSPGLLLFRLCHYPIVPIHGHRLYVVPASLFALFLIMCASTTIHI